MTEIDRIQDWYLSQCDGEWEHEYGLKISNCDNPGWIVEIDLAWTDLETADFSPVECGVGEDADPDDDDWYYCRVDRGKFVGSGGPMHLKTMLGIFLAWAERHELKTDAD